MVQILILILVVKERNGVFKISLAISVFIYVDYFVRNFSIFIGEGLIFYLILSVTYYTIDLINPFMKNHFIII